MKLSFSSISNYLNCPKKFYEVNVTYNWRDSSFASIAGSDVHEKIEKFIKGQSDILEIPQDDRVKMVMESLRAFYADPSRHNITQIGVEEKFAVDENFEPVDYKDPKAILRGKADLFVENGQEFVITDWKSGKKRNNSLQAHIYGILLQPIVKAPIFRCRFDYLEKGVGDSYSLRPQGLHYAKQIVKSVLAAKEFPERRNPLCAWCPVKNCSYWKEQGNKNEK
jgi:CRISPR/Cas system-associated exonuclease Cas4 (RecB family)